MRSAGVSDIATEPKERAADGRLTGAYVGVALVALFGGVLTGLLQALEHAGVNLYPAFAWGLRSYYHGLSIHGVLNVLVWTTFFICGFLPFLTVRALGTPLWSLRLAWGTFWLMTAGLVLPPSLALGSMQPPLAQELAYLERVGKEVIAPLASVS